ncbi:polymeric immunoglobulin receptor-like [Esox lucius]|uniref:polymeric immunoglobulin receptor-like n=1 Tax=Esox lucius TaxID=8010 RepID=UPI001477785E|nr:polymeric immunoglobulin receptor-like [Esox lucius]
MRILLIFTLLAFMTGCVTSFIVTGYSGGTVIIYCYYNIEEESNGKYFCMGQNSLSCEEKIRTRNTSREWNHRGRVSLFDNTGGNYIMVVIRQLTREDEGTYRCGVDKPDVPDSYTKVELEVKEDICCNKSLTEMVYLGGEANIICNYQEEHEYSPKYFCQERNDFKKCSNIISADSTSNQFGRFSLIDNRTEKRFTVTIRNLTEDDTGTYWCGVHKNYISLITKVQLSVIGK